MNRDFASEGKSPSLNLQAQAKSRIGEILLRRCKVKKYQLDFLLKLQSSYSGLDRRQTIGELLVLHRAVSPLAVQEALAVQEQMPQESVTAVIANFERTMSHISRLLKGGLLAAEPTEKA